MVHILRELARSESIFVQHRFIDMRFRDHAAFVGRTADWTGPDFKTNAVRNSQWDHRQPRTPTRMSR
jgi:hypothetical protein